MRYRIRYHREVVDRDIPALDGSIRERVRVAIERRLATEPARYGKPLGGSLAGLRRLRVGDFRVVFRIAEDEVLVVGIGHRKQVYHAAQSRHITLHEPLGSYQNPEETGPSGDMPITERQAMNPTKDIKFDAAGLVPAIVQDAKQKDVLMMAWMNEEALRLTLETGFAHYYSRSRQKLWKKGETSGHVQRVHEVLYDCDADCVLLMVDQAEAACHTGHRTCFYRVLGGGEKGDLVFDPSRVYSGMAEREALDRLYGTIVDRVKNPRPDSYTNQLLSAGYGKMKEKVVEEATELAEAAESGDRAHTVREAADLLYHAWVILAAAGVKPEEVYRELARRAGKSGLAEKAERNKKS